MPRTPRLATSLTVAALFPTLAVALAQEPVIVVAPAPVEQEKVVVEGAVVAPATTITFTARRAEGELPADVFARDKKEAVPAAGVVEVRADVVQFALPAMKIAIGGPAQPAPAGQPIPEAELAPLVLQFTPQLRPTMRSEQHFIRSVCSPTEDQRRALAREGHKVFQGALREYATMQHQMMRGQWRGGAQPDPRKLIVKGLEGAVDSCLTKDQAARYREEVAKRAAARKAMMVRNLVARLDSDLVLTADQRDKLSDALAKDWDDAWCSSMQIFMYGDQFFPMVPDKVVLPVLNDAQKAVWNTMPKNQVQFSDFGMMDGMEMAADPLDEEAEEEEKRTAEALKKLQEPQLAAPPAVDAPKSL